MRRRGKRPRLSIDGAPCTTPNWRSHIRYRIYELEYLAAKIEGKPLYQLLGARGSQMVELYDGSIYIDDLEADDDEAVEIFREEVRTGREYGYRNFKIKIGRGAQWMPVMEGLERDILVIRTVWEAAGEDAKIMVDANNGLTLNIAKEILERCAGMDLYWFEEPFAEDTAFNEALKGFIRENGYDTLVADGESNPPPNFFEMVQQGQIDVVQHDFRAMGLTWWKATAAMIEPWGARCAPHCWGPLSNATLTPILPLRFPTLLFWKRPRATCPALS